MDIKLFVAFILASSFDLIFYSLLLEILPIYCDENDGGSVLIYCDDNDGGSVPHLL